MKQKKTGINVLLKAYQKKPSKPIWCVLFFLFSLAGVSSAHAFHPISSKVDILSTYPVYPVLDFTALKQAEAVKRGEYLVKVGDCIACHTDSKPGSAAFAGGLPIASPFGDIFTPNITPDKSTGIGNWSEADFMRVMREGILADGSNAFPAFPYVYFNRVTDQDLKDIWAYLRAIPAVVKQNQGNTLLFPANVRFFEYGWKMLFFYPDAGVFEADTDRSQQWNRGAYLVEGLGHCTMCHTPMNLLFGEEKKYYLTGAFVEGYWAPDITGIGLQTASRYEVSDVFKQDQLINQAGTVRGPMADANHDSLQYLNDYDRLAIAEYLKSIVSRQPRNIPKITATQTPLKRGQQVYANVCVICHLNGEVGAPRIGDQADWRERISQNGLPGLYRHAINGYNKMPPRGACVTCDDQDVIAAVEYLVYRSFEHSQWYELKNTSPMPRKHSTSFATGKTVYQKTCSVCHDEGKLGAPKVGDLQQWAPRIRKNFDVLVVNTFKGVNNMPAKGGCTHCTGSEIIAAVKYMVQESQDGNDYSLW